jgi:ATP-dependent Lon protease
MSDSEKIIVENAPEGSEDAPAQLQEPREIPILPVRHTVLFPFAILPINVGRERSLKLLNDVMNGDRMLAVFAQMDGNEDDPAPEGLHETGTIATVLRMVRFADNRLSVLLQGSTRVKRGEITATDPYLKGRVEPLRDIEVEDVQTEARAGEKHTSLRHIRKSDSRWG